MRLQGAAFAYRNRSGESDTVGGMRGMRFYMPIGGGGMGGMGVFGKKRGLRWALWMVDDDFLVARARVSWPETSQNFPIAVNSRARRAFQSSVYIPRKKTRTRLD